MQGEDYTNYSYTHDKRAYTLFYEIVVQKPILAPKIVGYSCLMLKPRRTLFRSWPRGEGGEILIISIKELILEHVWFAWTSSFMSI